MRLHHNTRLGFYTLAGIFCLAILAGCISPQQPPASFSGLPQYQVNPFWPQPLKDHWLFGQVSSVAVDRFDHVWVLHRPKTLLPDELGATQSPPTNRCCIAAPAVMEFDAAGHFLQGWGGAGKGYDWPSQEHGIHVDQQGFVWISGNDKNDHHILKFTREGQFVLQIGKPGKSEGSNSHTQLGQPAAIESDSLMNEIYVGDGYGNRRVIVFDATTGAYKRHWGAYAHVPDDGKLPPYQPGAKPSAQFGNPHCIHLSRDKMLFVCDRPNNRIQVFQPSGQFIREMFLEPLTLSGPIADLAFSADPEQRYLLTADGSNSEIYVLDKNNGQKLASFGRPGHQAGEFRSLHNIAIDSTGALYTVEAGAGRRIQKFILQQPLRQPP